MKKITEYLNSITSLLIMIGGGMLFFNTIVRIYQTNSTNAKFNELNRVTKDRVDAYNDLESAIQICIDDRKQFLNHLKTCKHK